MWYDRLNLYMIIHMAAKRVTYILVQYMNLKDMLPAIS